MPSPRAQLTKHVPDISDVELVTVARNGGAAGRHAYSHLVRRHHRWLIGLLSRSVGSSAEDVAQDAFVRAYLALPRARPDTQFRPWLRQIATRLAANHVRDTATRSRHEGATEPPEHADLGSVLAARTELEQLLPGLSDGAREVLGLHYVDGLSIEETGARLGLGPSAVKMRLARARSRARQTRCTGRAA